jgi:hypothetical protein
VAKFLVTALLDANCCVVVILTVVNVPAAAVVAPIDTLSIVPVTAGLIVITPDPVGLMVTGRFAGDRFTAPVPISVVNVPGRGVVIPIAILSSVPAVDGLIFNVFVTFKLVKDNVGLTDILSVLVAEFVVSVMPLPPAKVNVFVVAFKPIVLWPETAIYVYALIKLLLAIVFF